MDIQAYRDAFFVDPEPESRYSFAGSFVVTLFFGPFDEAVRYYTAVLGPPAYVEEEDTRGWRIGSGWLTLLQGEAGGPSNVEVCFRMETAQEAERLQRAFLDAGGTGPAPRDELMFEAVRYCPVRDPFGTDLLVFAPLESEG